MATNRSKAQANAAAEAHAQLAAQSDFAQEAISAKIAYNLTRPYKHGKAY